MQLKKMLAVESDHVTFAYARNVALDGVSVAVPEGSYVGIVGPNGGGKTTLVKLILGILTPTSGSISIFGVDPLTARKNGKIGYVPQRISQTDFSFPATVEEVVWSGRTPVMGIGARKNDVDKKAVEHAMEISGIAFARNRLIGHLSGGERQKAFIARSLASEPRLLILDEPTTGVDIGASENFYTLLKKLNKDLGLTILIVSHDMEVMTKEVSFVLALNQKLICHCSAHEFLSEDVLKKLYGHDVEMLHSHTH